MFLREKPSTVTETKKLFKSAMEGAWNEVVNIYENNPEVQNAKITSAGDTPLHIAVSDCQVEIVEQLVKIVSTAGHKEILKVENERGNMPLHFAASMGNVRMCECIADMDSELIGVRNKESETPFFLAALHGKKDAFLRLHYKCNDSDRGYSYCRRNIDGETVLHSAITGEYFDLAFQIIHLYKNLVNSVNEQGFTPLHILANKPSSFRSGSHLGRFQEIIYHYLQGIFVDELKLHASQGKSLPKTFEGDTNSKFPENYGTCINFFNLLGKIYQGAVLGVVTRECLPKKDNRANAENHGGQEDDRAAQRHQLFPPNYGTCFEALKIISKAMLIILGLGSREIRKLQDKKEKHTWSVQIMNELLAHASLYDYEDNGINPQQLPSSKEGETTPYLVPTDGGIVTFGADDHFINPLMAPMPMATTTPSTGNQNKGQGGTNNDKNGEDEGEEKKPDIGKRETPILIAAKHGVLEMVEKILEFFPVAIHDMNSEKKNVVLLAVENRQPHVYQLLHERDILKESIFHQVDNDGNSALHLAAKLGEYRPWLIPGAALQMQWEIKWYKFVKNSMPPHFFVHFNTKSKTPKDTFTETHSKLVESGGKWLTNTSESCSVVAALIATVAFATAATVPGGLNEESGIPNLENQPAFCIFAIASLVALCFSVTAVVMFLAILTSRYQERDFGKDLPMKLLVGLTSLFVSIASMLVSFCAGHFFVLKDKLKYATFPIYAVTCLPVTFFALAQFPLYFDLVRATLKKVPQRSFKVLAP